MFQLGLQCGTPDSSFSDSVQQALHLQGVPKEIRDSGMETGVQRRGSFKLLKPKSGNAVGWEGEHGTQIKLEIKLPPKLGYPPPFPGDYLKLREIKDQPRITQRSHNRAGI